MSETDQPPPKTRDFRGPGQWRTQAVRSREAALAVGSEPDDDVAPEGDGLEAVVGGDENVGSKN